MDIYHDFWIDAEPEEIFKAIASSKGLDAWWTLASSADPQIGGKYDLGFGPGYDWVATVERYEPDAEIEWKLIGATQEWLGTRVGLRLEAATSGTTVHFHHSGWPDTSGNFRISSFCWAMYLRLLKKYVETGSVVPYEDRLKA